MRLRLPGAPGHLGLPARLRHGAGAFGGGHAGRSSRPSARHGQGEAGWGDFREGMALGGKRYPSWADLKGPAVSEKSPPHLGQAKRGYHPSANRSKPLEATPSHPKPSPSPAQATPNHSQLHSKALHLSRQHAAQEKMGFVGLSLTTAPLFALAAKGFYGQVTSSQRRALAKPPGERERETSARGGPRGTKGGAWCPKCGSLCVCVCVCVCCFGGVGGGWGIYVCVPFFRFSFLGGRWRGGGGVGGFLKMCDLCCLCIYVLYGLCMCSVSACPPGRPL